MSLRIMDGRVSVEPAAGNDGDQGTLDADGRFVMPGLWDSHVHFDQWAAARQRIDLAGTRSATAVVDIVAERLRDPSVSTDAPLIGYGFRDGLWSDRPSARLLDSVTGDQPVVMISADLHAGWLNTAALRRFGIGDHPTGLLREQEWIPITGAVGGAPEHVVDRWVASAAEHAAARGVVGIVDFEFPDSSVAWTRRIAAGQRSLRVHCSVWPERLDDAIDRGHRTGDVLPGTDGLATQGPLKVISDGSLNTRTAYCRDPYPSAPGEAPGHGVLTVPPDQLERLLSRAKDAGLTAAVHAIGDEANHLALDAFQAVGVSGSIEHAQLLLAADAERFAGLGIVASVQPEHALDDRDVADRWWPDQTDLAFAYGTLLRAGATLALGSDAPVAPLDPWITLAAAVSRTKDDRPPWHPEQQIPFSDALRASTGGRTTIGDGDVADLVIIDGDPFTADAGALRRMPVFATVLGGRFTFRSRPDGG